MWTFHDLLCYGLSGELWVVQDIRQIIDICAPYDKMNKIQDYLRTKPRGHKTIVFCGTKRMCDQVCLELCIGFNWHPPFPRFKKDKARVDKKPHSLSTLW